MEVRISSLYTIQVLVITKSVGIAGNNILEAREELWNTAAWNRKYMYSLELQNSPGKQLSLPMFFHASRHRVAF